MTSVNTNGVVEFSFYRPGVSQVAVVGDFNGWRKDAPAMSTRGDGWWRARAVLEGGDYRFRYLADQTWFPDYASNGVESDSSGWNSLLVVPTPRTARHMHEERQVA